MLKSDLHVSMVMLQFQLLKLSWVHADMNLSHSRTHRSFTVSVRPTPPAAPKPSKSMALPPKPTPKDEEDDE
jgi:hypothetical protein